MYLTRKHEVVMNRYVRLLNFK